MLQSEKWRFSPHLCGSGRQVRPLLKVTLWLMLLRSRGVKKYDAATGDGCFDSRDLSQLDDIGLLVLELLLLQRVVTFQSLISSL